MTHSAFVEDATIATTMSEAVNEVNAAIAAAVTAGDTTSAFAAGIENLNATALENMVASSSRISRLKRPAEDGSESEESVKLRKLQEAAAHATEIISNNASLSSQSSTHSSNHNSPNSSNASDAQAKANGATTDASSSQEPQVSAAVQEAITVATSVAATSHLSASSHSSIMADLERMQQLAKIDPAQLASYSTNPNNQATLEQLTSSALVNVLAQAPLTVGNLQIHQEHGQPHGQSQQSPVQGILMSMPTNAAGDSGINDSSSSGEEETLSAKRARNRDATNEERRQRRLLRNRVAAKECRKKKKAYIQELQDTCTRLQEENTRLYKEVEELNAKLTLGAMRIDENVRLIKEVEELNAKLTLGVMAGASAHTHGQSSITTDSQGSAKPDDDSGEPSRTESQSETSTQDVQQSTVTEALQVLTGGSA
ncbi:hypothetical protein B0O80DRAFT_433592 [Mortierella sp. GBAus27b]|nr:hypothetical protein BGX31_003830 [Mortierella sp. GBA43]KAI8363387.1 hypothetical protein B0O80DRAFT_433592 [Mortierella sp. GBAus27b]